MDSVEKERVLKEFAEACEAMTDAELRAAFTEYEYRNPGTMYKLRSWMMQPPSTPDEREKVIHATALEAYYRARLSGPINPDGRMKETLAAVRPLIEADALRAAARAAERVTQVYDQDSDDGWRRWMRERAEAIERGEVSNVD